MKMKEPTELTGPPDVLAATDNEMFRIAAIPGGASFLDLSCGINASVLAPGRITGAQAVMDDVHMGARGSISFKSGDSSHTIRYATPSLIFEDTDLPVDVVDELPKRRRRDRIVAAARSIFIQHPQKTATKPVVADVVAPCECMVVVQKRDGIGFFDRWHWVGRVFFFGWFAEEIKTITYCNVLRGGDIGGHIEKSVDLDFMFDPPPPQGFPTTMTTFCPFKVDP